VCVPKPNSTVYRPSITLVSSDPVPFCTKCPSLSPSQISVVGEIATMTSSRYAGVPFGCFIVIHGKRSTCIPCTVQKGRSSSLQLAFLRSHPNDGCESPCFSCWFCCCSHSYSSSYMPFWKSQIGSAFLRMNSSTGNPSIVGGRLTRFCFPFMKMVMYSRRLRLFSAFSADVSFRFRFAISECSRFFLF
jgi:hypothetical protein